MKLGKRIKLPFSLGQYQNGHIESYAEIEVREEDFKEADNSLYSLLFAQTVEEVNDITTKLKEEEK